MLPRIFVVAALTLASLGSSRSAAAQDPLAEGRRLYDAARFRQAIAAYEAAEAAGGLDRGDVVALLEARALAHHAADDTAAAEHDLAGLLSLAPDHELTALAPPALQRSFRRIAEEVTDPLSITATATRVPDGYRVESRVRGDVAGLVRSVRVRHRSPGGEFAEATGAETLVPAAGDMDYIVEAVGPGGAVIANIGSLDGPLRAENVVRGVGDGGGESDEGRFEATTDGEDEDDGAPVWPWILVGAGGLAVAAAIVLVVLLVGGGSTDTQVSSPIPGMP